MTSTGSVLAAPFDTALDRSLHVLMDNAGVMPGRREVTGEGSELALALPGRDPNAATGSCSR